MDRSTSKKLLDFCKKYKSIICYGASEHGYTVKHYLELNGVKVVAFMISDDVAAGECRDGIPVYPVKDVKIFGNDVGIVLSLYERHHDAVVAALYENGRTCDIYPLSDDEQILIRQEVLILERKNTLARDDFSEDEKIIFEQCAKELLTKYKKIECRFMDVFRIGAYAIWVYLCWKRKKCQSDSYYLYYPITHQHHDEEKLRGPNGYLLTKFQDDGIACISEKNISFWQYMYSFHRDIFIMNDGYQFAGYTDELTHDFREISAGMNLIQLSAEEKKAGDEICHQMGLVKSFVCISNRDIVYLQTEMRDELKPDIRDRYRNSEIREHIAMVEHLGENNIQTVRMGVAIEKELRHPNMINYAGHFRSEFMDVYLVNQCKFFVGDYSGILAFAMLMAKPMVILNVSMLTDRYDAPAFFSPHRDIAILKKLYDKKSQRYLTIRDMLNFEVNICRSEKNLTAAIAREYSKRQIVPIDNTSQEILEVVQEMNQRLDGTVQYDDVDAELQKKYREIVDEYPLNENVLEYWRLGAKFLRRNQWLLE